LEGGESADLLQAYSFEALGLSFSSGIRSQLTYQSNKLVGGAIIGNTGGRKNKTDPKHLDVDGEQNISAKKPKKDKK
jgi:hypothetical protein